MYLERVGISRAANVPPLIYDRRPLRETKGPTDLQTNNDDEDDEGDDDT